MPEIPIESPTLNYIATKGWEFQESGVDQVKLKQCLFCDNDNWRFYINVGGSKKDGLWQCFVCNEAGNLHKLRESQGDKIQGVMSMRDSAAGLQQSEPVPPIAALHTKLMEDEEALDYLVGERGFSTAVIEKYQLGVETKGDTKWLVIPYVSKGVVTFVKYRSLPPAKKEFRALAGREAGLYNVDVITSGMPELLFVEGEADCLSCLSNNIEYAVGIPGANVKKATWIKRVVDADPKQIYLLYDSDMVGQKAAKEIAKRIGIERCLNICLPSFKTRDDKEGKDINEWFQADGTIEDFEILKKQAKPFDVDGVTNLTDALKEIEDELEQRGTLDPTLKTPWKSLDLKLGGCEWGDLIGIIAEGKVGKEQPISSKILTKIGWTTMDNVYIGQELASVDGKESKVIGIFPRGIRQIYKITFSDGRTVRCGLEHLWKVGSITNFGRDGYRLINTLQLLELLQTSGDDWFIPLFNGEFSSYQGLSLDPWLVGAMLGDGGFSNNFRFTNIEPKIVEYLNALLENYECKLNQVSDIDYNVTGIKRGQNFVRDQFKSFGLMGKTALEKFIPEPYLVASRRDRLALLQGLMDTDGSLEGNSNVPCFNTSSHQLAKDVQTLVQSLGGIAPITNRITSFEYKGVKKKGEVSYRVYIKLDEPVCLKSHKASKEQVRTRNPRLTVESILPDGEEACQCIMVSHPDNLYITDNYVVTHNTTMCLNWLDYYVSLGIPSMMYCLEMMPKRLARKWVSFVTQTDDTPGRSLITKESIVNAKKTALERDADLLFAYTRGGNKEEVYETIRQAVRLYGVKVVCFDNLQLLCRSIDHSAQETSVITKGFKDLAMELGIVILLVVQPNRVREGEIVAARNAMGSSAIEKDVDSMIALHRKRIGQVKDDEFIGFLETESTFEPQLLVKVDLNRYGPGGITTLFMEGNVSTVREFGMDELNNMPKPNYGALAVEETRQAV